ncbi:hypothetical protein PUN28_016310 [Cardiocondyla obscurior]|uniref:methylated-DNA--[protein]-cysteine S-methyltransferase n=1 Tax=Cardiocondyla obscurior TaxID=286306 RepID=A0AAW2EVK5_9HYME
MNTFRGITLEEYKAKFMTFQLVYAFHQTPFGKCLIAVTDIDRDLAYLTFVDDENEAEAIKVLKAKWSLTRIREDTENRTGIVIARIFDSDGCQVAPVCVIMKGTLFQIKIWRCLMEIPKGTMTTYEDIAQKTDCKAPRAVGGAISRNYIAYVVPCHRVTHKLQHARGITPKYIWGRERRSAILEYEAKEKLESESVI